ncbi:MAG TPA: hypothetical protein VME24_10290 [Alphaproteobacteria bacterium]|nr:hypothetical protein [Alphaproteobacteria bacterium]
MKIKSLKLAAAATVLTLLAAGCVTLSVYPFYTPKDLIFDSGLTGRWVETKSTNTFWKFDDVGGKFYLLTTTDSESTNGFEANLFQLRRYRFLDLLTTNRDEFSKFEMPVHLISRVDHNDTNVSLHFLDYGWLANLLQTNPALLRHIIVPEQPGGTNGEMLYLTAETEDLQTFILKYADDTNAFGSDSAVELKLLSP